MQKTAKSMQDTAHNTNFDISTTSLFCLLLNKVIYHRHPTKNSFSLECLLYRQFYHSVEPVKISLSLNCPRVARVYRDSRGVW